MSGHSKWSTIKRKKEKTDAARGKVFTKIGREITVIVKAGGPDPDSNAKLRDAIAKAKANNMPNDNIMRCIKKASGANDSDNYEEITYEGYGPSGVAVIVETLTDNRNRTAGDMRHYFDKFGGNLGQSGCVSFMFDAKGVIIIDNEEGELDEDTVMMDALDSGAEDFSAQEGCFEILTDPDSLGVVRDALEEKGYTFASAEVEKLPQTTVALTDEKDILFMTKLIDTLEDNDDVQNVYHNWEE
ncbi:MAG: YebC/PmpR family DNA-binding transcriptional regulator [Clostridia bacterium]|nr:YebC/PmpR family DNA-binding transcriptional regulator [Clostridia bacterium]